MCCSRTGASCCLAAVNRFVTVSLSPSTQQDHGTINSSQLSEHRLKWHRNRQQIVLERTNEKADILLKTMEITEQFLSEMGINLPYYDIDVKSTLDSADGRKYGLGSSGAVTVAAVKALLDAADVSLSDEAVFKLAAVTHILLNSRGSLGDLAAATYTGWVAYTSPDKKRVKNKLNQMPLSSVLNEPWPKLSIERLPEPKSLELIVGWTGSPASTESYVASVQQEQEKMNYQTFLAESRKCVRDLIDGLKTDDPERVKEAVHYNRTLLLELSQEKNVVLETPLLERLTLIADSHGAAAKTSGAGGGDCGIALTDSAVQKANILKEWQENHIEPLPLSVYDRSNL
ncbi:MAG: phosphomevalonate kinase [Alkalibacterium sp.]|nr:phosphomevalonate kinase [Alkalibacterium sp.]